MLKTVFFILIFSAGFTLSAQYRLEGVVEDTSAQPLGFTSVVVLNSSDSSVYAFGLSNANGFYRIEIPEKGEYLVQYSFLGYAPKVELLKTDWKEPLIQMPKIQLQNASVNLKEVEIAAERIPMKMKGDTLVFDAAAFKTRQGAELEKLLEKLPGVEIDENGNITAQGKAVNKILVNGKEFFGSNPQMATKNLDAEAVEKVEILDKKSEKAEFTGIDDGEEEKTINITLKEEYKKGYFGKAYAALGTEDTYKGSLNYNRFNEKTQFSIISGGNNLNQKNFSYSEYSDFQGGNIMVFDAAAMGSRQGDGITESFSAGANLNHEFSEKMDLTVNYFYVNNENELFKKIETSNFTPDETFETVENQEIKSELQRHSSDITFRWEIDSSRKITYRTGFTLSDQASSNLALTNFSQAENQEGVTTNSNQQNRDSWTYYSEFDFSRKFEKKGRVWDTDFYINLSNNDEKNDLKNNIFNREINQFQDFDESNEVFRVSSKYTEPIAKNWFAALSLTLSSQENEPERLFFDRNSGTQVLNDSLSGQFKRETLERRIGAEFKYNNKDLLFSFGVAAAEIELTTNLDQRDFQFLYPFLSMRWKMKGSQNLRLRYSTSTNVPNLNQLLTIPNNINPNQNYVGNSSLEPEYAHRINLNYYRFDPIRSISIFARLSGSTVSDKIVNRTVVKPDFTRFITPENTDLYQKVSLYGYIGSKMKKYNLSYSFNANGSYTNYEAFLNNRLSSVEDQSYRFGLRLGRDKNEKWDLDFGINYSFNRQNFDLNSDFNQNFDNISWFAEGEILLAENLLFSASYTIRRYTAAFFSAERTLNFVNLELRKSFNNELWAVTLIANDILNENVGIRRSGDVNSLRDEEFNSRARYFMIGVSRKLGKRKEKENNRFIFNRSR